MCNKTRENIYENLKKAFKFSSPTAGSAPGPPLGLCPQIPVMDSRYRSRHGAPYLQILATPMHPIYFSAAKF